MSETTYYQKNREVILNRAKDYYQNNKELLRERAERKYRESSKGLQVLVVVIIYTFGNLKICLMKGLILLLHLTIKLLQN